MRALIDRRPSPAMVISLVALFAALSGTAVAAKVGSNDLKKNAVKTKNIAGKAVTANKLDKGAVKTNKLADGAVGPSKLSDEAHAYARVNQPGTAVTQARGVVGVNRNSTGRYCLDLSFVPNTAVASIDFATAAGGATAQTMVPASPACPAPFTDATVFTFGPANNSANNAFYVQFD